MNVKQVKTTYISRTGGQHLEVSLAQPELKSWLASVMQIINLPVRGAGTLEYKISGGIAIIRTNFRYDQVAQQAEYKHKHVTADTFSPSAGVLFTSTAATEPHQTAGLGHLVNKQALVCREKAMLTHLFLAELGIPTTYQPGTVIVDERTRDGHAWVEWVEPATGRNETVHAVIDGTSGKVYTNFSYERFVHERLDSDVFFEPINVLDQADISVALGKLNVG